MILMIDSKAAQRMDNEFYKSEEQFLLAMRGANDGLWDWNLECDEVYYSPRWKNMLGYEEDELSATIKTWKTLVHPDDRDFVLEKVQDYIGGRRIHLKLKCVCNTRMVTTFMFCPVHF